MHLVAAVTAVVALTACRSGGDEPPAPAASAPASNEGCGTVVVEPLDPRSTQHLLPGAPPPSYATDPPTSGPHLPDTGVSGARTGPLDGPVQVGVLEEGGVVVQYRPDVPEPARAALAGLAGDKVVVAPNPDLAQPVVATAWRHRLTCRSVDVAALRGFISERVGKGPG